MVAIKIDDKEYDEKELAVLAKAGVLTFVGKHDPASTTLDATPLHGPFPGNANQYGIFSAGTQRPGRLSTLVRPRSFMSLLKPTKSEYTEEIIGIMTGQTAGSGSNATSFCGNPPEPGQLKKCDQVYRYGSYYIKTRLNSVPEIGQLRNRADVAAEILNAGPSSFPFLPDLFGNPRFDTRSQLGEELYKVGNETERSVGNVGINGNRATASASTQRGWIQEFDGLDGQIKTGYADTAGLLCPAADSTVISFNVDVAGTIGGGDGRNIVHAATDLYYGKKDLAGSLGLDGVQWVFVGRPEQFRALTETWACNYATYRCSGAAGTPVNQDAAETNRLRIEMQRGKYLLIDNEQIPFVEDEFIARDVLANLTYKSDLLLVPVSWNGMPLVELQYYPMDNQYSREFQAFADADSLQVINNGMFLVGSRSTPFCKEYHFAAKMRLILVAPFLAGRIDDIWFTYRAPTRDALPGASFHQDGGATYVL